MAALMTLLANQGVLTAPAAVAPAPDSGSPIAVLAVRSISLFAPPDAPPPRA
jgi:hypothetical protein